ncbi:MAG TPA: WecB/TagA/CpsF family glycosyltransferase [Candidatus Baltobacteraceae bacterium]|jgi:N-acetylglucosaminyldiphosphoundecaprenol N-acetyl-beta-D-mannosaminyltransferase
MMEILGCRLDPIDTDAATDAITGFVRERRGAQIVTLGTEMVVYAQKDAAFRQIVNACTLSLCDTIGLLAVARSRGASLRERVTGVELIERIGARAASDGLRLFLLGGAPGIAQRAALTLQTRYPHLQIAGARDGYFADDESVRVVEEIRASGADVLFAGLGSPRQEVWLARHLRATGCGAGIGVGGSFDVISGNVRRAPVVWRRMGVEWLYRLIKEPKRWRRQLALPQFVYLIAAESMRSRFSKRRA